MEAIYPFVAEVAFGYSRTFNRRKQVSNGVAER